MQSSPQSLHVNDLEVFSTMRSFGWMNFHLSSTTSFSVIFAYFVFFSLLTLDSGRAEHCIPCPKLWVAFDGDCYRLVTEKLPWVEAEKYCRELSNSDWFPSHLVSINSLEEQQFIVELLKASYPLEKLPSVKAWLGYNDMERETRFVWSASSGANFTRWARNQPDNGGGKGQDCVAIIQENNWKWDDMTCRFGRHFICELKMLNGRQ